MGEESTSKWRKYDRTMYSFICLVAITGIMINGKNPIIDYGLMWLVLLMWIFGICIINKN